MEKLEQSPQEQKFDDNVNDIFNKAVEEASSMPENQEIIIDESPHHEPEIIIEDDHVHHEPTPEIEEERRREINIKKKLSSIQREKNRLADENRRLSEEVYRSQQQAAMIQQQLETSGQAAMYHNEEKLKLEQANLRESYKKANEIGDYESSADISVHLGKIGAKLESIDTYKAQQTQQMMHFQQMAAQYQQNPYAQQYQHSNQPEPYQDNAIKDYWISKNPWFNEESHHYDPDKAEATIKAANVFEQYLSDEGRHDLINTPYYYDEIDKYVQTYKQPSQQPRQTVAPVRRTSSGSYTPEQSSNRVHLSKDAIDIAKRMGVDPKTYAKELHKIQKNDSSAMNRGDFSYLQQYGYVK